MQPQDILRPPTIERPAPTIDEHAQGEIERQKRVNQLRRIATRALNAKKAQLVTQGKNGVARRPEPSERKDISLALKFATGANRKQRRAAAAKFGR